jgi:hypothetical protein
VDAALADGAPAAAASDRLSTAGREPVGIAHRVPNHCMQPTRAPGSCVLLRFGWRPCS